MYKTVSSNLHSLADFIVANEELWPPDHEIFEGPVNVVFNMNEVAFHVSYVLDGDEAKDVTRKLLKQIGGKWVKDVTSSTMYFTQEDSRLGRVIVFVPRDAVCERRVTGTHEVAVAAVKATEATTRVVEDIEWDCGSILSPSQTKVDA